MAVDLRKACLEMRAAGEEDFPPACLDYLYRLIHRLSISATAAAGSRAAPGEVDSRFRQLSAAELIQAFQQQARSDFGGLAGAVAERWGIRKGEDIGRVILLLARYRCLSLGAGESLEEYAAVGDIHFV